MHQSDYNQTAATVASDSGTVHAPPFAQCARWMSIAEQTLAALFLFLIVSTMGAQVFARYFFGAPFSWSEEVARLALIWMTFMAAAFVMGEGRHITVDVLSHRLSIRGQAWLESLSHVIVAGTCLLLLFGGMRFVWYVGKVGSPSLGIPMSWWYGAVGIGLLMMAVHSIVNLLQVLATGRPTVHNAIVEEEGFHLELERGE
ncbi:TRAP transporter small permease [Fuerstiella marisgermanici]|uniref:2,3-diketo-L-gulonate TRAP transporter small permease protein YiaM n=1 Tax=Fuerstiella marisgermanici TaxID=1891926 RepID=A0A1P8WA88_9PLAN|nr:TRAP transporter small permease [Fuerstiella marisgermanici]APZ90978.1 2,3-diketo-L-gulonate TRAP transporter small permease protein YiaM [Fuerstiella marisgermanici]